jgi:transcription elongation factor Elf1
MRDGLASRKIRCPYCAEMSQIQVDLSAGDQNYIEDCQVCCQPIQLNCTIDDFRLVSVDAQCST